MKAQGLHPDDPARYRIYIQDLFDAAWLDWLSGTWVLQHRQLGGYSITILMGDVADQAALLSVLEQLYCLGFPLLRVEHLADQVSSAGGSAGYTTQPRPVSIE